MLIICPECELQVSDKAITCPHCGYPMQPNVVKKNIKKTNKRKKLPNGFGQITKISNKFLRKPYRAMVTIGKDSRGKPIVKPLKPESYFETYNDAYQALVEYNRNPYDLSDDLTVLQLYTKWSEDYFKNLKAPSIRTVTSAWAYCSEIYDMRAKDVRARHIKGCMDNGVIEYKGETRTPSPSIKARIKSLFNLMFDYAEEYDLVEKNYARTFDLSDEIIDDMAEAKKDHIPFTDDEIKTLWNSIGTVEYTDVVIIQCYSGWRPQELGLIKLENVDLENWTFVGGMKTDAGIERIVPIHSKIRHLIESKYQEAVGLGSEYLFNCTDSRSNRKGLMLTYDKYQYRFEKLRDALNLNPEHRPHDPRMHFVTMAKEAKVDEYAIKRIVGHKIKDLTESVYTARSIEWLQEEIEKIK